MLASAGRCLFTALAIVVALCPVGPARAAGDAQAPLGDAIAKAPWPKLRALSVTVLVDGHDPTSPAERALADLARQELEAAARTTRPRVHLEQLPESAERARHPAHVEVNLVAAAGASSLPADVTYDDLPRRRGGGYDVGLGAARPLSSGGLRLRARLDARVPAAATGRAERLAAREDELRARGVAAKERTRALVQNGEFSEIAAGRRELWGMSVDRARLEDVVERAYRHELAPYALLYAESTYNGRNRTIEAIDVLAEAEVGALPDWYAGQEPSGVRRLRATDGTIEERPYYPTEGDAWAAYHALVEPRRASVQEALEDFVAEGRVLVIEDEHCAEEPLSALAPFSCAVEEEPVRLEVRPADGSARPEQVRIGSALWHRISSFHAGAVCQPVLRATSRALVPEPLATRCDLLDGGVVLYTSLHADELPRDSAVRHAFLGGGPRPSAIEAALLDAPLSGPGVPGEGPDGREVVPTITDRAAVRLAMPGAEVASSDGAPAPPRTGHAVALYVGPGEGGYVQVNFSGGPLRVELRSPSGRAVASRVGEAPPLLIDLAGRHPGLYELRLYAESAGALDLATVQHLSTVTRDLWTGGGTAAWTALSGMEVPLDGFGRGSTALVGEAAVAADVLVGSLVRLALEDPSGTGGRATLVVEGHASEEGSDRTNDRLSLGRAVLGAVLVVRAAERATGARCTVDGETCATWLHALERQARAAGAVDVSQELRVGPLTLPVVLRPSGSRAPLATCAPRDEPCLQKNRRAVLRLERS